MVDMSASSAVEALPSSGGSIHVPANGTCLRTVVRRHFNQCAARPRKFVAKHFCKTRPSCVRNATRQATSKHTLNVEILDHDDAVALGKSCRLNVQEVFALTPHFTVQTHYATLGFLSVLRSLLTTGDYSLSTSKTFQRTLIEFGVIGEIAVTVGERVCDATIDGNDGRGARYRIGNFDLTEEGCKPLVPFTSQCAGLRFAYEWPVNNGLQIAELRESECTPFEPPIFWVRLLKPEEVTSFALPPRSTIDLFEAVLPSVIKLCEQLTTHIPRHICQPRQIGTKVCQLFHLAECCRIALVCTRETHQTLLMGNVPEEAQGTLPPSKPVFLFGSRVDAIAERFVLQHSSKHSSIQREL